MTENIRDENIKFTKTAIDWRRNIVLQRLSKGWSQSDIARELKLHPSTISLDVQYLKIKAQDELRKHITEVVPFEYARAVTGINDILRRATDILDKTTDPRLQYQYMTLLIQVYGSILSMATEKGVIEQAMKKVEQLQGETKLQNNGFKEPEVLAPHDLEESSSDEEPEEDLQEE
jgi:transcriptional regulator with XRE-family HTH domain